MIAAGLVLLGAAVVISWGAGLVRAEAARRRLVGASWLANIAAAAVFAFGGALGLTGSAQRMDLGGLAGFGPASLGVDALSGLFLVVTFGVAVPALAAAGAPANRPTGHVPGCRPRLVSH